MKFQRQLRSGYEGILAIGDPHIEARQPGFRSDDYPHVILQKLRWCLGYARKHRLLTVLLGDIFDKPRDNPTWLICRLIELMQGQPILGIFGNHDCAETTLTENDSLSILVNAGCIQLVSRECLWQGKLARQPVIIGGSSYREPIPSEFDLPPRTDLFDPEPRVLWLAHHDIGLSGFDGLASEVPREIVHVDMVINGHIHRRLEPQRHGQTLWVNPGNISRRTRGEASQNHVPAVLQIDFDHSGIQLRSVEVPHQPYSRIFHPAVDSVDALGGHSTFVAGLVELKARRTQSGAGLHAFLDKNLLQFPRPVSREIRALAREVTADA